MASPYIDIDALIEPFVAQIKEEIKELTFIDELDEGEETYSGTGTKAMVIPGAHNIRSIGMQTLEIRLTLFVILITSSETKTLAEMRKQGYQLYNKLMADVIHRTSAGTPTCWVCLPRLVHPGFMTLAGLSFVGVQTIWEARFHQTYAPP